MDRGRHSEKFTGGAGLAQSGLQPFGVLDGPFEGQARDRLMKILLAIFGCVVAIAAVLFRHELREAFSRSIWRGVFLSAALVLAALPFALLLSMAVPFMATESAIIRP